MKSRKRGSKKRNIKDGGRETNNFLLVSLKGCPYCESAKELIKKNPNSKMINLDLNMDDDKQKKFWNKFVLTQFQKKHNTFPKIFREGEFLGGYSELKEII